MQLICDAFFVPALSVFCEKLHLPDDFAGATLMALGGNAPDVFSGVIGVLVLDTDVGAGTIVGSLLFNHLCIIGCTVLAVGVIKLDLRSVSREMFFYFVSIIIFAGSLWDEKVTLGESIVYLVAYVVYVVFCWFTPHISRLFSRCCHKKVNPPAGLTNVVIQQENGDASSMINSEKKQSVCVSETTPLLSGEQETNEHPPQDKSVGTNEQTTDKAETKPQFESLFAFPHNEGILRIISWLLSLPFAVLFTFTIPDVRRERFRNMYLLTFLIVLIWLGVMAYAMVFGADNFARCLCIPEDVMGLTITAIGESLPSMFGSVIAAKQGLANMAISNAFGSNLCSILLALGLPIFVHDLVVGPYDCRSNAIITSSVILLVALVLFIIMAAVSHFTLYRVHGFILLFLYAALLGVAVTFGILDINPFAFLKKSSSSA